MEQNWIREYELVFVSPDNRIVITSIDQETPLDIAFTIQYEKEGIMALSVFGLKESNIGVVSEAGVKVYLNVGYKSRNPDVKTNPQDLQRLFTGDVITVNVKNTVSGIYETKLQCRATKLNSKPLMVTYAATGTEKDRIKQMILDAQLRTTGLIIDKALEELELLANDDPSRNEATLLDAPNLPLINEDVVGSLTTSGTVFEELSDYCSNFDIVVATINQELHLVREGGALNTNNKVDAILGQNLLQPPRKKVDASQGSPASKTSRYRRDLKMLLAPTVNLNTVVVSNVKRNDFGTVDEEPLAIKAVAIKHTGRYYGVPWYTEVSGTVEENWFKDSPVKSVESDFYNPTEDLPYD